MITTESIVNALAEAVRTSPHNYVSTDMALVPEDVGQRLYDDPIIAIGAADDPLWEGLKAPQAVGHLFTTPREWMAGAKCVVSYFATLLFRETVRMMWLWVMVGSMLEWRVRHF